MALTPINFVVEDIVEETETTTTETEAQVEPSLTLSIDLVNGRLGGYIDGDEAIQQFARKAVYTARNRYLIYDDEYGCEIDAAVSQSLPFSVLEVEIPRLITDALIYDDRIENVSDFTLSQKDDGLYIGFTITLVTGESVQSEVTI